MTKSGGQSPPLQILEGDLSPDPVIYAHDWQTNLNHGYYT